VGGGINGFPNPALPKVDHEPTFEDIHIKTHLLNANVIISVPSMAGGDTHGHLVIITTPVGYVVISATPWETVHVEILLFWELLTISKYSFSQYVLSEFVYLYIYTLSIEQ
jgi:hypothetical protein